MDSRRPSWPSLVRHLAWIGAAWGLGGCSGSSSSSSAPATFTEVYEQVLGPQCGQMCHMPNGSGVTLGMLDLSTQTTAFNALVEVAAAGSACAGKNVVRVIPGNVDQSLLAEKIDPKLFQSMNVCGSPMPLDENALPQTQIDEVESWIAAGAKND
ncbi:MAG TPA: hypothetical protein VEK07_23735 [Polyangiaceae bacterium]|nr:hypothetical protein [Polyangiaceae bacterium]